MSGPLEEPSIGGASSPCSIPHAGERKYHERLRHGNRAEYKDS